MTPKFKTKDTSKSLYVNFLQKARECFHAAENSLDREECSAAAISAIHAAISACDAMCVYFLGKRHSGEDHNDAALLFKSINTSDEISVNANRIVRILKMKNMAEYEERLVRKNEAETILKDCERLLGYVEGKLPKGL